MAEGPGNWLTMAIDLEKERRGSVGLTAECQESPADMKYGTADRSVRTVIVCGFRLTRRLNECPALSS